MGACEFFMAGVGATARAAFRNAQEVARYEHGHSGYTGTIAEKVSFVMIPLPAGKEPRSYAEELIVKGDRRIDDKWGPAGCIQINAGEWLFFGWASE